MKMKFTLFVIISIMICGSLNAQHFETNIQELYQRGYYYYDNEDYEKAIKFFDDILEIDSNHYYANLYKGIALISLNKLNEGLILLKKPFLLDSIQNHALIYLMIGETYLHLDEYDMAIENISKSISSEPMFGYSFMIRGSSYTRTNEYEKAIEDFNRAIELGEETLLIYFERGTAYYFMGNYEAAATDFLILSQNSKNDFVQVDYYLGEIFFTYQYFERAISHFKTFIHNKGDDRIKNLHAIFKTGVCNYFLGNYKEALKYFDEIHKEEPDYLGAFIYKGMTYIALEEIDIARTNLEIALSKDPQNSLANHQMGIVEFLSKNTEKGNEYFKVAKESAFQTKDDFALFGLAESYMLLGDTTNALDCLNKVIFLNPNHYKALEARISLNSYFLPKKESDVLDDFELLLKVFKGNEQITAYYIAQKSIFLFELGRFDQSIAELEKAIQVHSYFEYYALRALLLTYKELKISLDLNRNTIPSNIQNQILNDIDKALQSNHRRKDAYLLKTTILIALDRNKEACEAANEAIKLGASINKDHLNYICKGKKSKEKNNEWEFFYNLSSFEERFSE
jgi:tetratricopeptide (TPR) repeat protein